MPSEEPLDLEAIASAAPEWRAAFETVGRLVGGRVVEARRQARWRPAWFLTVERDGERVPVYFRGDRGQGQGGGGALEREMGVLQVLERHGIPAPHVHGFCEKPRGIVMQAAPGRANLATARDDAERVAVLDHYMELLARMHAIDPAEFEKCGLDAPASGDAAAWVDFARWESGYRQATTAPEPLIELCILWLRRNVPADRGRRGFLTGDAGQFLFEDGRVTAVIDLELATLGDPLADLGALRSRDVSEPLGDLSRGLRRYAEVSGESIDRSLLNFHAVRFALNTPLAVAPLCQRPPPGLDYAQYLGWKLVYGRLALEIIAEEMGVGLTPPALPPEDDAPEPAHDALLAMLGARRETSYEADAAFRVGQYLRERALRGDAVAAADLDEAAALLGARPGDRADADARLEARIRADGFEITPDWIRFLHRRMLREEALLRPAMRELADARFQKLRLD
ncbi:MAG: phosphotransferase family protein [Myxococcota bacterium]